MVEKISKDDPRTKHMSSDREVSLVELVEFVKGKNRWVLSTARADGRPQMSLVSGGMTTRGELAVASYPSRAKVMNAKNNSSVSVLVMGSEFNDEWVQIDGTARVYDMPEAADGLVEYFRCISGEHPDWDEYRKAMADQGKSVILIEPTRWGPVSKGGFPPSLFED
ncbi:MAG: PPOX class F420-dependent oxidoreductase [Actinomycetia bacterium]|nr:PPOX class F420-dependent oxidoreductase [Actinomycetes bacterium]MCP4957940.1 PPOX class F420-dependent oxidoreductase [Actinomycetes bacterium]